MKKRLCKRWAECRFLGYVCFHDRYHGTMSSCDDIGGKVRFKGNRGTPSSWDEADACFVCGLPCDTVEVESKNEANDLSKVDSM
jgi:hypothetical protein